MVQAVYSVAQTAPVASTQPQQTDNNQACNQQQQGITEVLSLRLAPRRKAKAVRWSDDTVDNEFMNKKKSKKCCIFHKQKSFGDWSDNDSDDDCEDCATSDEKQGS